MVKLATPVIPALGYFGRITPDEKSVVDRVETNATPTVAVDHIHYLSGRQLLGGTKYV